MPALPAVALAIALHVGVFAAAFVLPRLFDRRPPPRKPIIAHLVALGRPRDPRLLPRKESPPPSAASRPVPVPSTAAAPSTAPPKREPSRSELMQRALARAAGKADTEAREPPDPERAGSASGSVEGTAATAEEGDAYFTAGHQPILEAYVGPSGLSQRERRHLAASVLAWVGPHRRILRDEFPEKAGH